jgi:excisionase family DNA binding protein
MKQLAELYDYWLRYTGDVNAAATLVLAQVQSRASTEAMTVVDVAKRLGVSKETIYKLCNENVMPHCRVGRRISISPQQLAEYQSSPRFRHLTA